MAAAMKCGSYEDGLAIYSKLRSRNLNLTACSSGNAIRLHSRLGLHEEVLDLWQESESSWIWTPPRDIYTSTTGLLKDRTP
mmetsp:Transcript_7782/g.17964  ORF Transcript_7782/g.17964 Transcript_7782/m.17964 type:complete len:81 (+) Transcript_7782:444-686(+)